MKRKLILLGSTLLVLLAGSVPAKAQESPAQEPTSEQPAQEAPQAEEISQEDLQKFAQAMEQLQTIRQEFEAEMVQAVESEGLTKERFIEISQTQSNPEAQPTSEVTEAEQQSFEKAIMQLRDLQQAAQTQMKEAVQAEGLDVPRFNQILAAIQQNPELQQQIQQMNQ